MSTSDQGHARYKIPDGERPEASRRAPVPDPRPATGTAATPLAPAPPPRRWARRLSWCGVAYAAAMVLLGIALLVAPRGWWPLNLPLFCPLWLLGAPLLLLLPSAILARRWLLVPLVAALLALLFPIGGLAVPWRLLGASASDPRLRVLTCNTDGPALDPARIDAVVARERPDLVLLQDWQPRSLPSFLQEPGWKTAGLHGGFLVASRWPIRIVSTLADPPGGPPLAVCYEVEWQGRAVRVVNLRLPTLRSSLSELLRGKLDPRRLVRGLAGLRDGLGGAASASDALKRWVNEFDGALLVAGDFNLPAGSPILRADWGRLHDAFSTAGLGFGTTYYADWKYRLRLDRVLAGGGLRPVRCRVAEPVGSEHRPVVADFAAGP